MTRNGRAFAHHKNPIFENRAPDPQNLVLFDNLRNSGSKNGSFYLIKFEEEDATKMPPQSNRTVSFGFH